MGYVGGSSSGVDLGSQDMGNVTWKDNFSLYPEMTLDAVSPDFGLYSQPSFEVPNLDTEKFYRMLKATNRPL